VIAGRFSDRCVGCLASTGATPGGCGIGCGIRPIAARNLPGHRAWLDDLDG